MQSITTYVNVLLGNDVALLLAKLLAFSCNIYLLIFLIYNSFKSNVATRLFGLLIIFVFGAILNDIGWLLILTRNLFFVKQEYLLITFVCRFGWAIYISQYHALSLFLEYLTEKRIKHRLIHLLFSIPNILISGLFLYILIFKFYISSASEETLGITRTLIKYACLSIIPILAFTLYKAIQSFFSQQLPKILRYQLKILIVFFIAPHILLEVVANLIPYTPISDYLPLSQYTLLSISTLLASCAIYYCANRIMGLRFLNTSDEVESKQFNFINSFNDILEELSQVTNLKELTHLTHTFFKTAFNIPSNKVKLHIRKVTDEPQEILQGNQPEYITKTESFIIKHFSADCSVAKFLQQSKICIKDELKFTNFYHENNDRFQILDFLNSINADIFLPIFERQTMSGYIIVEHDTSNAKLFNNFQRDQMLIFTSYLSNTINILKHSNLELALKREKELQENLYLKHQEINQYKESIRSFLRTNSEKKIGIIFYKSRKFSFANEAAKELVSIDINSNPGHPLAISLKNIVKKVTEYKTVQTTYTKDKDGNKLMINAISSLDPNNIIIMIYYPEISDIIKLQINNLNDPSKWDYLLYLETTTTGQLISQLIPGSSENLLSFKINLLSTALSKKATLLNMAQDDLLATVEILHHISLRQTLHVMTLTTAEKNDEIGIRLFGINPIFEDNKNKIESILQKLDNIGTLFIQNIELLHTDTQNALAEFITFGFFHKVKSDNKIFSNVRIIASTTKNLEQLVAQGLFSKTLFNELNKTTLTMPSLTTMPLSDVSELATGFAQQSIKSETFKNLLQLNDKDKLKIFDEKPISLKDLKLKIQSILAQKSNKHHIYEEVEFNPALLTSDPELADAIRLGKKALKDRQIMTILWNKFKNQNKIATLLNVNRSSVNRRCQEFNLND